MSGKSSDGVEITKLLWKKHFAVIKYRSYSQLMHVKSVRLVILTHCKWKGRSQMSHSMEFFFVSFFGINLVQIMQKSMSSSEETEDFLFLPFFTVGCEQLISFEFFVGICDQFVIIYHFLGGFLIFFGGIMAKMIKIVNKTFA